MRTDLEGEGTSKFTTFLPTSAHVSAMVDAPNAISHSIFYTFYMRTLFVFMTTLAVGS